MIVHRNGIAVAGKSERDRATDAAGCTRYQCHGSHVDPLLFQWLSSSHVDSICEYARNAVGNALEVREAVSVLRGETRGDLFEICVSLAAEMISLVLDITPEEGIKLAADAVDSGAAFEKMKEWVALQGGDASCLDDPSKLPTCPFSYKVKSPFKGYITSMNAEKIGIASMMLGAGRKTKDDMIDYGAGIVIGPKVGDFVEVGDTLCTLYSSNEMLFEASADKYLSALSAGDEKPEKKPLIYKVIR